MQVVVWAVYGKKVMVEKEKKKERKEKEEEKKKEEEKEEKTNKAMACSPVRGVQQ